MALNGYVAHLIDHETFGLSSGVRNSGCSAAKSHCNVTAMLYEMSKYPSLPTSLYGFSMGGLVLHTYLLRNPELHIAGAIFQCPFWNFPKEVEGREAKLVAIPLIAPAAEDFLMMPKHITMQGLTADNGYCQHKITTMGSKGWPFSTPKGIAAMISEFDCVREKAHLFRHSMLMVLGG